MRWERMCLVMKGFVCEEFKVSPLTGFSICAVISVMLQV